MEKETKRAIYDSTLIGDWDEIQSLPLSKVTKNSEDDNIVLDGIIFKGYETKFAGGTNENGERYSKDCIDNFIKRYFVDKKLNMPLDVEHDSRPEWLVGRVVYVESNSTGFYFVGYVPRSHPKYEYIKMLHKEGIIQGFSKCGWCTKGHWERGRSQEEDYYLIEEMEIVRMSLVTTPANGIPFERVQEIQNALRYRKVDDTAENTKKDKKSVFKH